MDNLQPKPSIWQTNPKLKMLLLILIFVFLFSGIGLTIFSIWSANYREKINKDTEANLPKHQINSAATTTSESPLIKPTEVASWKTYNNKQYGFEFEIPSAWQPVEKTKQELIKQMRAYSQIPDPKGEASQPEMFIGLGNNIHVNIYKAEDYSAILENQDILKQLKSVQNNFSNFKEITNLENVGTGPGGPSYYNVFKTKIAGISALDVRSSGSGGPDRQIIFEMSGVIYILYTPESYFFYNSKSDKMEVLSPEKVDPDFEKILATFKFTK